MPSQKRKSSAGSSERLSPWQNYEEAKKVEANLLQTLALLKGDGLSHDDKKMRTRVIEMVSTSLDLVQKYLGDEGHERGASRPRSSAPMSMERDEFKNLGLSAVQFGPAENKLLACQNRHDLDVWHDRLLVPSVEALPVQHREPLWALQPQYAGTAACLVYSQGKLTEAYTLSSGHRGEDILKKCQSLVTVPPIIPHSLTATKVFGTFTMRKCDYQTYLEACQMSQPRVSLQSFIDLLLATNGNVPPPKGLLDCLVFAPGNALWDQEMGVLLSSECGVQQWVKEQGFSTFGEPRTFCSFAEAVEEGSNMLATRSLSELEIAGVGLVINSLDTQQHLGSYKGIFWRFPPHQEIARLKHIAWVQLPDGPLEPVAEVEPVVELGGLSYTFFHFRNLDHLRQLHLKIPDCIVVARRVGMEPEVLKAVPDLRVGEEYDWDAKSFCPVCSSKLEDCKQPGVTEMHCSNLQCPSEVNSISGQTGVVWVQPGRLIRHFANICIRASPATIDLLQERGLVRDVGDLFQISQADLEKQGLSKRTAKLLSDAVTAAKALPLDVLLQGLGIRHMNQAAASALSEHFRSLKGMEMASVEELQAVQCVGMELACSIFDWFRMESTKRLISALTSVGLESLRRKPARRSSAPQRPRRSRGSFNQENIPNNNQNEHDNGMCKVENKRIAFCGKLCWSGKSREAFRAVIEAAGGKFCAAISGRTDIMVIGTSPERCKLDTADEHGVLCVEEESFFKNWLNVMDVD